jgi:hypothetical protein
VIVEHGEFVRAEPEPGERVEPPLGAGDDPVPAAVGQVA